MFTYAHIRFMRGMSSGILFLFLQYTKQIGASRLKCNYVHKSTPKLHCKLYFLNTEINFLPFIPILWTFAIYQGLSHVKDDYDIKMFIQLNYLNVGKQTFFYKCTDTFNSVIL